jgi:hypothetical protein
VPQVARQPVGGRAGRAVGHVQRRRALGGVGILGAGLQLFGGSTAAAGAQESAQAQANTALYQAQVSRNNAAIAQRPSGRLGAAWVRGS